MIFSQLQYSDILDSSGWSIKYVNHQCKRFAQSKIMQLLCHISFSNKHEFPTIWKSSHCVKSVRVWSFSGPYFSAFGLYGVYVHIQFECGKIRTRKTPNTDTSYARIALEIVGVNKLWVFQQRHIPDQQIQI